MVVVQNWKLVYFVMPLHMLTLEIRMYTMCSQSLHQCTRILSMVVSGSQQTFKIVIHAAPHPIALKKDISQTIMVLLEGIVYVILMFKA